MKLLNHGLFMLVIGTLLMQTACSTQGEMPLTNSYPLVSNTKWHYMDTDWEYDMEFISNGTLRTKHPNDKTPNNDTWRQSGEKVYFYFNNKYSTYQGSFSGDNIISGTAESKTGAVWNWKAVRVDEPTNLNK
ncbi:MAG: hypothetical protein Q9M50_08645 [Methylococcales bacterium]|nr:hypothetical protein [Methylococcales bacterium]